MFLILLNEKHVQQRKMIFMKLKEQYVKVCNKEHQSVYIH